MRSGCPQLQTCHSDICPPANAVALRSPDCWYLSARCGCWTSRPPGLILASERRFSHLLAGHLEDDGIIVAATHTPLGLDKAKELVMGEWGNEGG
jgi:hypothetical protein